MLYWIIAGLILFIIEIFTPIMFFMNLGLACLASALTAALGFSLTVQVVTFVVASAVFLLVLRPFLIKRKSSETNAFSEKYIGKTARVIEKVTTETGRIKLYDEEWEARSQNGESFEVDSIVKIVRNDSIVMYVSAQEN